eukprot:2738730-Alexandrium_andersonii.AAC.1
MLWCDVVEQSFVRAAGLSGREARACKGHGELVITQASLDAPFPQHKEASQDPSFTAHSMEVKRHLQQCRRLRAFVDLLRSQRFPGFGEWSDHLRHTWQACIIWDT